MTELVKLVEKYIHSGQKLTQVALLSELAKQVKMTKVMKDEAKQILRIYKKEQKVGGALSGKETKEFIKASYEKKKKAQKVGDYTLDKSLSSKKNKVYVGPKGDVVISNAGTSSASDWVNNARIGTDYKKTKRYKDVEKTQKKAIEKYGLENITNVAHSQSGHAVNILAKKGLTKEAIAVNPALLGTKANRNVDVVRSSADVVSALAKGKRKTIKAKSFNPLTEHSADILRDNAVYGKSYLDK